MKRALAVMAAVGVIGVGACEQATQPNAEAPVFARGGEQQVNVVVVLDEQFAPGGHAPNQVAAGAIARSLGVAAVHVYGSALFGFSATVPQRQIAALERDPRVRYVQRDREFYVIALAQCPVCGGGGGGGGGQEVPWGIQRIGADQNANEGSGIHVYVIDTGIDSDHPDLQANLGNGFAATTCKGRTCNTTWDDDHGHGTHVSGTIGAIDNDIGVLGVAAEVTLHAVKVCTRAGFCSGSDIIAGIDWVTSEVSARGAAAAANMSLGGGGSKTGTCDDSGFSGTDAEHEAMCNARNVGVVFAVAAGNDGADAENTTPAAYDDVALAVSATNASDDWPSWSNWGDNSADWTVNVSAPVAIAAPGVSVLSTWNDGGTNTISGTSMASPHLAGTIALFLKTNSQAADGSAFSNARAGILAADESTDGFSNTSGNPHDEDFVDARSM